MGKKAKTAGVRQGQKGKTLGAPARLACTYKGPRKVPLQVSKRKN